MELLHNIKFYIFELFYRNRYGNDMSDTSTYKSPPHKLIKFFKESRDNWEEIAKKRRAEIRDLQARVRDLEVSRASWKEKAKITSERAQAKEKVLECLKNELAEVKETQTLLQNQIDEYKKKLTK
jgi:hypothetical protein